LITDKPGLVTGSAGPVAFNMLVESPEGSITVKGTLAEDAQTFQGQVIYLDGKIFPMSGRRR
jgi:hypothetical protein